MRDDFAILILSHGRADNVCTVDAVHKAGYTGRWYIIIDDEDDQEELYYKNFGKEHIVKFNKLEAMKYTVDAMDNFEIHQVPVYARNVLFNIAKDLGLTYFLEMEDDFPDFRFRYVENDIFRSIALHSMDKIVDLYIDFLVETNALIIAFSEGGDFLGGHNRAFWKNQINRKAMMCYFCRVDRPFQFYGTFNDDVNMYVSLGQRGELIMTVAPVVVNPRPTQVNSGGITDMYNKYGTYTKSFYSVMIRPDCVKVAEMTSVFWRVHHSVKWETAVPKIISDRYKKR